MVGEWLVLQLLSSLLYCTSVDGSVKPQRCITSEEYIVIVIVKSKFLKLSADQKLIHERKSGNKSNRYTRVTNEGLHHFVNEYNN